MKTRILFVLLLCSNLVEAADRFTEAMVRQIEIVYNGRTADELVSAVNAFERIAGAEPSRWEPLYYSAFGNVMLAIRESEPSKKDQYLDRALDAINRAYAIAKNESELVAMEGFIHMIRVSVNPAARGQQYSSKAFEAFSRALEINPENPRALALMAQMEFGTAQFFRSSTQKACETNEKSLIIFARQTAAAENVAPAWGESMAKEMKSRCDQNAGK